MTFGEKLRAARKEKKLTQKGLAELIHAAHNSISNWENNQNKPDPDTIQNLCWALGVTPNYFFLDDTTEHKQSFSRPSNIMPLPAMKEWPVLGATACGKPLHREMLDETVLAPADIKADIVFRCVGDSMINARIFDGDTVFIRLQPEVENGQIAVLRIGDAYTLKRVYVFDHYVELRSENPTVKPIILRGPELEPDSFEVVGLAVAFMSAIL